MTPRFGIHPDDQALADAITRFAQAELAPHAHEVDEAALSTVRYVPALAELGVMGMNLPEAWGGPGATPTALVLSLAAIAEACASTASMIGAHYLATDSVLIGGDDAMRARYLPGAADGRLLGAFALTELDWGSFSTPLAAIAD